jgi:hypothetical protein
MERSDRRPGTGNYAHPQLTHLEQSGSVYELQMGRPVQLLSSRRQVRVFIVHRQCYPSRFISWISFSMSRATVSRSAPGMAFAASPI